jgi:hypothetical protein
LNHFTDPSPTAISLPSASCFYDKSGYRFGQTKKGRKVWNTPHTQRPIYLFSKTTIRLIRKT